MKDEKELTKEEIERKNYIKKVIKVWTKRILIGLFCVITILLMIISLFNGR